MGGRADGRNVGRRRAFEYGLTEYTRCVYCPSVAESGTGTIDTEPVMTFPM